MTPEQKKAMLEQVDHAKLAAQIPAAVIEAVQSHGLHKVAAELTHLPEVTESTVALRIGQKLAARRADAQVVNAGLVALASLGG